MATLNIVEYSAIREAEGGLAQIPHEPSLAVQNITFSAAESSAEFSAKVSMVRIVSDVDCYVKFGSNPTATVANATKILAGQPEYFGVVPGMKLSVYDGVS